MSETASEYTHRLLSYIGTTAPLTLLKAAPARLADLITRCNGSLDRSPQPGKWSPRQIACHLADGEAVFAWRIRSVLANPGAAVAAFDPDVWCQTGRYGDADVTAAIAQYAAVRRRNVELIEKLSADELSVTGTHSERGVESVARMVEIYAGHDINHFLQIERILESR